MELTNCRFPVEIMMMILSHLPIKSLVRFRCVCNSWFRLLTGQDSDLYFTQLHDLQTSIANSNPILICNMPLSKVCFHLAPCYTQLHKSEDIKLPDWYRMDLTNKGRKHKYFEVSRVCNGLVSITCSDPEDDIFIWNLFTRDYVRILCPRYPSEESVKRMKCYSSDESIIPTKRAYYGFGFCLATNEYKIVRVVVSYVWRYDLFQSHGYDLQSHVTVYTLGTNTWRIIIENVPGNVYSHSGMPCAALVNGALHWITSNGYFGNGPAKLVSFDLKREVFQDIVKPECLERKSEIELRVEQLSGLLAIFWNSFFESSVEIWVMKEYGVEDSWSKQFTIRLSDILDFGSTVEPIGIANDGNIMMQSGRKLLSFNPTTKSVRSIDIISMSDASNSHVTTYFHKCTLVSPRYIMAIESKLYRTKRLKK